MILALEGPPAVGKTTVAKTLQMNHGFWRIPEVNELFSPRPSSESESWYYERQIDRMALAADKEVSLLDGDPFQAIWFSWIYPNRGYPSSTNALDFFNQHKTSVTMPNRYVYLCIDEEERYQREKTREAERGHCESQIAEKWARYIDFAAPQRALFQAINKEFPNWVTFLEAVNLDRVVEVVKSLVPGENPNWTQYADFLENWLKRNSPDEFRNC